MQKKSNTKKQAMNKRIVKIDENEIGMDELKDLSEYLNLDVPKSMSRDELVDLIFTAVYGDDSIKEPIGDTLAVPPQRPLVEVNRKRRERFVKRYKQGDAIFAFLSKNKTSKRGDCDVKGVSHMSFCDAGSMKKLSFQDSGEIRLPRAENMAKMSGYMKSVNTDWFVVCDKINRPIFVNDSFVKDYNLERYDNIEFTLVYDQNRDEYALVDIVSLNGKTGVGGRGMRPFEELEIVKPDKNTEKELPETDGWFIKKLYDVAGIHRGERLLIGVGSANVQDTIVQELSGLFKNASFEVFTVYLGSKSKRKIDETQVENYIAINRDESLGTRWENLIVSYSRAERVAEVGGNAVIILNGCEGLHELVVQILKKTPADYKKKVVAEFFELGSIRESGGSLTVVFLADNTASSRTSKIKEASTLFVPIKAVGKKLYEIDYDLVTNNYFGDEKPLERKRMRDDLNKETENELEIEHGKLKFT